MKLLTKETDTLSLETTKKHLLIDNSLDDDIIQGFIDSTLVKSELYLSRPITEEVYFSFDVEDVDTGEYNIYFNLKYKPEEVIFYYEDVGLSEEVIFIYEDGVLILEDIDPALIYDEIRATIEPTDTQLVTQSRLLDIGSFYEFRNNEVFGSFKTQSNSSNLLLDLSMSSPI